MVFIRLKEGCRGFKNRFRVFLDISMMLVLVSFGVVGLRDRGCYFWV